MRNLLLAISAALLLTVRPPSAAEHVLSPAPSPAENATGNAAKDAAEDDPQAAQTLAQLPAPRWMAAAMAIMVAVLTGERQRFAGGMAVAWPHGGTPSHSGYGPVSGVLSRRGSANLTAPAATLHHCGPPIPSPLA